VLVFLIESSDLERSIVSPCARAVAPQLRARPAPSPPRRLGFTV